MDDQMVETLRELRELQDKNATRLGEIEEELAWLVSLVGSARTHAPAEGREG